MTKILRLGFLLLGVQGAHSAPSPAEHVTALADRYVAAVREKFPLTYGGSGLPDPRRDALDINSGADLAEWRSFLGVLEKDAQSIDERAIRGKPEWITLAQLLQTFRQERAIETCRSELWAVRTVGWQAMLPQVAELQPVGDDGKRAAILARFGQVPGYVDAEITNLREGLRSGITSPKRVVQAVVAYLDELLAKPLTKSSYNSPAERDGDAAFQARWKTVLDDKVSPALKRYRDFLRDEYLPRTRTDPAITANRNGKECYVARIAAQSSVNIDPVRLLERANAQVAAETALALRAGKRRYGRDFVDLLALAAEMAKDPGNRFENEAQLRDFILATIRHGKKEAARVVPVVPDVDVEARPFPGGSDDTMLSGQYIPRNEEGRPPIYYYRTDFQNLSPSRLEATVLHEAWPGHHLQAEITLARSRGGAHALAQLAWVPGAGEGWATYIEGLARELEIYGSDLGLIGSVMDSMTPRLVADLGMHVFGWSEDKTLAYLAAQFPTMPAESVQHTFTSIASEPGIMVPYAAGALEIENMREELRRKLGAQFDLRQFHQSITEDGTVPFPALRAKLGLRTD